MRQAKPVARPWPLITDHWPRMTCPSLASCLLPLCLCLMLPLAALALLVTGCATPGVNPALARANTGYVDFHADPADELFWQVEEFDSHAQSFKKVVSELEPPAGGILRLAFVPGHHRLRVAFLNRVITLPAEIEVEAKDGKIIPVRVNLIAAGTTQVQTKDISYGATAKGRYGQRTKYGSDETVSYRLSAMAEAPAPYRPKEQMPYAR